MVVCVSRADADATLKQLAADGETACIIGEIAAHAAEEPVVELINL